MGNIIGNIECIKIREVGSKKLLKFKRTHTYPSAIEETFREQRVIILDNLVSEEDLDELRWYAINTPPDDGFTYNGGYVTIDSDAGSKLSEDTFPTYLDLSRKFLHTIPILKGKTFDRGWIFIHDSECPGVTPHADPGEITVNLWVTPNHCIKDWSKNGLIVYDKKHPPDWPWEDYNQNLDKIKKYLTESNAIPRVIDYKCNRLMAFDSSYFHETNGVSTKPGDKNKRINVVWMYNS